MKMGKHVPRMAWMARMRGGNCARRRRGGFVMLSLLALTLVLFLLLSLATTATYRLRMENAALKKELQARADRVSSEPARP